MSRTEGKYCGMNGFTRGHLIAYLERHEDADNFEENWDAICLFLMGVGEQEDIDLMIDLGWPVVLEMAGKAYDLSYGNGIALV